LEKIFNTISLFFGLIGGILCALLGGNDAMLRIMIFLVIADYATGLIKSAIDMKLSSKVGFKGICKKVMLFIVIATAYQLQMLLGGTIPLREITIMFFVSNEGLSILENCGEFIPMPDKLKDAFIQIRDKGKDENENK
jgi:toxin secretion/phage lysis holin